MQNTRNLSQWKVFFHPDGSPCNTKLTQIRLHILVMYVVDVLLLFFSLFTFKFNLLGPLGSGGGSLGPPLPALPVLLFFGLTAVDLHDLGRGHPEAVGIGGPLEAVGGGPLLEVARSPSPSGREVEWQAAEHDGAAAGTPPELGLGLGLGLDGSMS